MTFLPEVVSLSDIGLTGLVTLGVLLLFTGGLVPYKWHRETLRRCEVLEERIVAKDDTIRLLIEANSELAKELTPTVKQVLNALPIPQDKGKEQ